MFAQSETPVVKLWANKPLDLLLASSEHVRMTLTEARTTSNLTIREAATRLGISTGHLSDIENGKKSPSLELAVKIAALFPTVSLPSLQRKAGPSDDKLARAAS